MQVLRETLEWLMNRNDEPLGSDELLVLVAFASVVAAGYLIFRIVKVKHLNANKKWVSGERNTFTRRDA